MDGYRGYARMLALTAVVMAIALAGGIGSITAVKGTTPVLVRSECQPDAAVPKRQFRAMWIATVGNLDWPSRQGLDVATQKAEYIAWLDLAHRLRLNAVVVQVRPTGDTLWPSPHEPWSEWLTGRQGTHPGYDPLAFLVEEAHRRNLEFHAWFNPYRVSTQADPSRLAAGHPARRHPNWVYEYGRRLYYNPGIPEVRAFILDAILDAVSKYDVDAVHLDDYFYPYPVSGEEIPDRDTYARYGQGFADIHDWRRHNVDLLVEEMGAKVKRAKPWVKFGISPFGIWRNRSSDPRGSDTAGLQSYDSTYADSHRWVKEQWIDYVAPQIYWNIGFGAADYAKLVPWWSNTVLGTSVHLYVGQAAYKMGTGGAWSDPAELSRHLHVNRNHPQVYGDVHFSAKDVRADRIGGISRMVADHYSRPALVPVMPQLAGVQPAPPTITAARRVDAGVELTFRGTALGALGEPTSYAVYRFEESLAAGTCGLEDAHHLIATVRGVGTGQQTFTDTTAVRDKAYAYYLTALDRLHHESPPSPPQTVPS
ncbi:MAG: family 10 glycosylhydrolase [Actinomycetota bacterium]|nr:family 10 glycosylhydrolase [Actinomycetota bacterium]